ncbi:MAG: hypothetical protein E7262_11175 [Lachnospiraceae bacterium]|nr:hypothetical protein [Lachnospiraceae bacterium]
MIYIATPMDNKEDLYGTASDNDDRKEFLSNTGLNSSKRKGTNSNDIGGDNSYENYNTDEEYLAKQEKRLKEILESMEYIESARVMITTKTSREDVVLKDNPYAKEETDIDKIYESEEETVLVEDEEGNALPYVIKKINPTIEGIVVVVKSNHTNLEEEIIDVVLALFDIPIHKIKVMRMK